MMSGPGEAAGGLRLRIGRATIDASAHAAVMTAITEANARARVAGLPDELTPAVIDVAKAEALLAGLGAASALGGRALILDAVSLGISAASPTSADSDRAPVRLAVTSEHGDSVMARAEVAVDCALARRRAEAARGRAPGADAEVARLSAAVKTGDAAARAALTPAQALRYAVARTWQMNAEAVVGCAPGDRAATADRDAAAAAAKAANLPRGSMG